VPIGRAACTGSASKPTSFPSVGKFPQHTASSTSNATPLVVAARRLKPSLIGSRRAPTLDPENTTTDFYHFFLSLSLSSSINEGLKKRPAPKNRWVEEKKIRGNAG